MKKHLQILALILFALPLTTNTMEQEKRYDYDFYKTIVEKRIITYKTLPNKLIEPEGNDTVTLTARLLYKNYLDLLTQLLECGIDPDHPAGSLDSTLASIAVHLKHLAALKLLHSYGANLQAATHFGNTLLHDIMRGIGKMEPQPIVDIIQFLLDNDADPNAQTIQGFTPLMFLATHTATWQLPLETQITIAQMLIHRGAKIHFTTSCEDLFPGRKYHQKTAPELAMLTEKPLLAEAIQKLAADEGYKLTASQ